jgi:hypothetical protein
LFGPSGHDHPSRGTCSTRQILASPCGRRARLRGFLVWIKIHTTAVVWNLFHAEAIRVICKRERSMSASLLSADTPARFASSASPASAAGSTVVPSGSPGASASTTGCASTTPLSPTVATPGTPRHARSPPPCRNAAGCEITPAQAPPCPSLPHSPSPSRDEHARAGRLSGCGMGATCGGADRRVVLLDRRGRAFYRQSGCDVVLVPGETWPFPGTWSEPLCLSCTRSGRHSTAG